MVDFAVANPSFTVRDVQAGTGFSYQMANRMVGALVELGILARSAPARGRNRLLRPTRLTDPVAYGP